jgi:PAS domain S-box-containing protein
MTFAAALHSPEMTAAFPPGESNMADLIRRFDWRDTPLGAIEEWSGTLKSTVSFMLNAPLPLALWWGENGTLLYNDAYAAFAEERHPAILGCPVAEAWPEAADFVSEVLRRCRSGEKLSYIERPFMLRRGMTTEEIWLDLHYSPVLNRYDQVAGVLNVLIDTTQRLHLERQRQSAGRALRESEAQLQALTAALPQLIWTADANGRYDYFNERWREFTGIQAATTDVAAWLGVVHPEDREAAELNWRHAVESGQEYQAEYRLRRADGTWRWFLRRALPVRDEATGEVIRWLGTCTDIEHTVRARDMLRQSALDLEARVQERTRQLEAEQRERQRAESQLQQAQKMEALGNLTGGVAHDFNNLLQVIQGNLDLLARDLAGHPKAAQRVETALSAVDRGARLASQLLAFARRQPLQPRVVNIGSFMNGLEDMLCRSLGEQVEIETAIAPGLWNTLVDPGQVENAVLNLAINARDAMDGHGRLTIEADNVVLDAAYIRLQPEAEPGEYVMLAVSDTGSGMSPEVMQKVFEPFFTTKPEGKGTGLGLSMVYGFARQSGGHVHIDSELGRGTTIRLYLPRCEAPVEQEAETSAAPALGGNETVLVVEDDLAVREVVVDTLTGLGYKVLRARDAQGAMAIIESGMQVDLLFTDVVMPGAMRSTELVERARALQPRMAVLFTSGYAENAIVHGGRVDAGVDLLTKPYSRKALARKFRHVLANQAQRNALNPAMPEPTAAGTVSVLLVEDDPLIRESTRDLLARAGHRVRVAADGARALALLQADPCDVLISDIGLPGMSGGELATRAYALAPDMALVFASGYHQPPELPAALERRAVMLHKPYDAPQLLACLERAVRLSAG